VERRRPRGVAHRGRRAGRIARRATPLAAPFGAERRVPFAAPVPLARTVPGAEDARVDLRDDDALVLSRAPLRVAFASPEQGLPAAHRRAVEVALEAILGPGGTIPHREDLDLFVAPLGVTSPEAELTSSSAAPRRHAGHPPRPGAPLSVRLAARRRPGRVRPRTRRAAEAPRLVPRRDPPRSAFAPTISPARPPVDHPIWPPSSRTS
jgi:hypothetical protein